MKAYNFQLCLQYFRCFLNNKILQMMIPHTWLRFHAAIDYSIYKILCYIKSLNFINLNLSIPVYIQSKNNTKSVKNFIFFRSELFFFLFSDIHRLCNVFKWWTTVTMFSMRRQYHLSFNSFYDIPLLTYIRAVLSKKCKLVNLAFRRQNILMT